MSKILFSILLASILWSACKKSDIPSGVFEDPVFRLDFIADTQFSWTAGVEDIYLFTQVDRKSDNVLVMSGAFANSDCPTGDCPGSVRFEFRNVNQENFAIPDSIFGLGQPWIFKSPFIDPPWYQTVLIQWVRSDGKVFRSDFLPQQDSLFTLTNSGPWELNERGENTWKMDVDFSCLMFDSLHLEQQFVNATGVIAVGYR